MHKLNWIFDFCFVPQVFVYRIIRSNHHSQCLTWLLPYLAILSGIYYSPQGVFTMHFSAVHPPGRLRALNWNLFIRQLSSHSLVYLTAQGWSEKKRSRVVSFHRHPFKQIDFLGSTNFATTGEVQIIPGLSFWIIFCTIGLWYYSSLWDLTVRAFHSLPHS